MYKQINQICKTSFIQHCKKYVTESTNSAKEESQRMKQFHEKMKLQPIPRVNPKERFVDLMLVKTDPQTGEFVADSEKDPTKWGDWQQGGRVTDF